MIQNVQALRAIAALMVVLVHLAVVAGRAGIPAERMEGFAVGVDLFFMISGFIMVVTAAQRRPTAGRFLLDRIARIVPFYWLMTLGVFAMAMVAPGLMQGTTAAWSHLLKSLFFIPYARADAAIRPILFVGWSLNLEMLFYLIFAATLLLPWRRAQAPLAIAIIVALVAGGALSPWPLPRIAGFLTQPILLAFAAGMGVGLAAPRLHPGPGASRLAAWSIGPLLVCLAVVGNIDAGTTLPLSVIPATLLLLAALVAERGGRVMSAPWLQLLGSASYALYLTHPLVTQALTKAAQAAHVLTPRTALPIIVLALAISSLVAIVVHLRVERPISAAARRLLARPRGAAPAPPAFPLPATE